MIVSCSICKKEIQETSWSGLNGIVKCNECYESGKQKKKIKFEWEFIGDGLHGKFSNYRAKVFGGWIVKEITWNEHDDSISMVFLNDKNHEWEIDNE